MTESIPSLLIPGVLCTPRLYAEQIPALWRLGPVMIAQHTRDDNVSAMARRILASAPPRFALVGLSMGGYICFEMLRQAPERVAKLALLDTSCRPDAPEQSDARRAQISLAKSGRLHDVCDAAFPRLVHPKHWSDPRIRQVLYQMADEVGVDGFIHQQQANIARPDSRPHLGAIRCPALILVGDCDELTPPARAAEIVNGIGGARLVVVPECGHSSPIEQPQFVTHQLVEFIGSSERRS
jgi:pimeloyl-ACP methyl ester carboxylesterase